MKRARYFLLLILGFFASPGVKAGVRDTARYYFSLEVFGANSFYNMPNVQNHYQLQPGGFTRGLLLRWNMGRGFYAGIGYLYSASSFLADTTGIPAGALNGLERNIAYGERLLLFGKDFTVVRNRFTLGVYAGTLKGNMIKGRQYTDDVINYGPPVVVLYKAASYTYHPFATMLGARVVYQVSPGIHLNVYGFKRWFDPIDYTTMRNLRGRMEEGAVYRKWYGGFGLQFQFLYKPRTDVWLKGAKQWIKQL